MHPDKFIRAMLLHRLYYFRLQLSHCHCFNYCHNNNVRPIAAYRQTQRSSFQLGLRVRGHLALTDYGPDEPQWTLAYGWRRR